MVLHLIAGALTVELAGLPTVELAAGDCLVHPGPIAHRWSVVGDEVAHLFLVITRSPTDG